MGIAKEALSGHISYAVGDSVPFDFRGRKQPGWHLYGANILPEEVYRKRLDNLEGNKGLARGVLEGAKKEASLSG